ncbi:RNA-directed DNA polymerase [Methylophilus sp.]|uniref:RNA-directed DNA polymerase n=1 Tax=Methylophilus sp. TaxID=29541 RepID=UPI004035EA7B
MTARLDPESIEKLFESLAQLFWWTETKENLASHEVLNGLLDYGLFAEKIPPCFTSKGLSAFTTQRMADTFEENNRNRLGALLDKSSHDYIRYEALRDINIPRHMGIPHPEAYAAQAMAISKYWKEIATHCNKPKPAISRVYVRPVGDGSIFEMNYKGSESLEHEEVLQDWMSGAKYVVETDVSACFPSIYTHSIPWALHTKAVGKIERNITEFAGCLLDKCTQNTKDKQTNGLLIGPHASNIISEIVLTCIDKELQDKGFLNVERHIDDYKFYAKSLVEAESFVKQLGRSLRYYEMFLNERKTRVLELPRPSEENWRLLLNRFTFPKDEEINFSMIRTYLDLALECSQTLGKSTPLNYAIKTIAGNDTPLNLNERAKRMYAQEVMNLALAFPYLVPSLDTSVFERYRYPGLETKISRFAISLIGLGLQKLYPDTIAHALYLTLKYNFNLAVTNEILLEVLSIEDCVVNILLLEYVKKFNIHEVRDAIQTKIDELKSYDSRESDKQWLLIYQLWSVKELRDNNQHFLAELKEQDFQFFKSPTNETNDIPQ